MNGAEFVKMVRDINQEIPIIIHSIHVGSKILSECINYGIQGYIQKPINNKVLHEKINEIKNQKYEARLIQQCQEVTHVSAMISKVNLKGIFTYVNETYYTLLNFSKDALIGQHYSTIQADNHSKESFNHLLEELKVTQKVWTGTLKYKNKYGELHYFKTTIQPIVNRGKQLLGFITLSIPITDIVHPEEQLNDYLEQHEESMLLLVKIEEFKYLEQSFTQKITQKMQKLFAEELLKCMPTECNFTKVYLLNNGEFAFVKPYNAIEDTNHSKRTLQTFQHKINQEKIKIGIIDYSLSIIISVAYGKNTLQNAKIGLKKLLKSKEEFIVARDFLDEVTRDSNKKLNQFNMLKKAIETYNIVSYFQPIIDNKTKKIAKFESLVRLIDEDQNILTPYHFLEVAKEGQYYHTITIIVLKNSFRALFNSEIEISINLSALDMEDERIRNEFLILAERYKTETHRITIEIVEDEKIKNQKNTLEFINQVRSYGIKIALDDFGKGFSNFARIQTYQPDYIKIDGSLVKNIEHDNFSKSLIETIVFFAKKQKIKTVAEYVENENIYTILTELGVDYSQGHYFSKAALLKEFIPSSL